MRRRRRRLCMPAALMRGAHAHDPASLGVRPDCPPEPWAKASDALLAAGLATHSALFVDFSSLRRPRTGGVFLQDRASGASRVGARRLAEHPTRSGSSIHRHRRPAAPVLVAHVYEQGVAVVLNADPVTSVTFFAQGGRDGARCPGRRGEQVPPAPSYVWPAYGPTPPISHVGSPSRRSSPRTLWPSGETATPTARCR